MAKASPSSWKTLTQTRSGGSPNSSVASDHAHLYPTSFLVVCLIPEHAPHDRTELGRDSGDTGAVGGSFEVRV